ncbi:MAG TPA: FecR family protein [Rectinemataceae bacterium]|nr:FecR family protein [Rectinemataceae bacterium]
MKRHSLSLILLVLASMAWSLETTQIGKVDYIEGGVSINRVGKTLSDPNIDDPLYSGDLIKTAGDGMLVIAMDRSTGMGGTITIRSRAALYINISMVKGQPKTSIDLLAGSIGSKVSKLSGSPTMAVNTNGAVMGVRGTEYGVAVSVNEAVLVTCTEGQVAVTDGGEELPVPAGKALEKRPGEKLRYLPVAVSSVKDYNERWIADEIEAFKADAPRALADYAKRYNDLSAKFAAAIDPFQKSATVRKWFDEDRTGVVVNPMDPAVLREKKEVAGLLLDLRRVLFLFERVYYRVDDLSGIIAGTPYERTLVSPGVTAGDFLHRVADEREQLSRQVARFRYAEKLYEARSPEGEVFGSGSGNDDFFKSPDGF